MIKFISYDGKYPCLCMGTLCIEVNGTPYFFKEAMHSGGCIMHNEDWDMWAEQGEWEINLFEHPELEPYKEEITRVVNENVPHGCCGGCYNIISKQYKYDTRRQRTIIKRLLHESAI